MSLKRTNKILFQNSHTVNLLVGPQLSRTSLGNVLLKKKRFSADGQNIAQNCTTMRVVEITLYWTAASPRKKICNQSSVRKLRLQ